MATNCSESLKRLSPGKTRDEVVGGGGGAGDAEGNISEKL